MFVDLLKHIARIRIKKRNISAWLGVYLTSGNASVPPSCFKSCFYDFIKTSIWHNEEFKKWTSQVRQTKKKHPKGRFYHGIYSNQCVFAYFLDKNGVKYENIRNPYIMTMNKK